MNSYKMRQGTTIWLMLGCLSLLLAGCGGGGGGGSSGAAASSSVSSTPPTPPISVSPSTVTITAVQGSDTTFNLTLVLGSQIPTDAAHIFLKDPDNVVTSQFDRVSSDGSRTEVIGFHVTPTLSVGDHEGDLGFFVCSTSPCGTPYSPTPVNVHYTIMMTGIPYTVTLSPSSINLSVEQGDPASLVLDAAIPSFFPINGFWVTDPQGRFSSFVPYNTSSAGHYAITLNLPPVIDPPGTYTGTISLQPCYSSSCSSLLDVPGPAVSIPYTFTVTPFVPLAARPTTTGLPEWETYQGNAGHTGFVPVTLDSTTFAAKWSWTLPGNNDGYIHNLNPVSTGSNKAVFSVSGNSSPASVIALNETDGTVGWQHDFGALASASDSAVFGGRVFLVTIAADESASLQSLSMSDGSAVFQTSITSQWAHYLAPTIRDGYVYTAGGSYGGLYAIKDTTGVEKWFTNNVGQVDLWTPAVDSNYVYAHVPLLGTGANFNGLSAFNLRDGGSAFSVATNDVNLNDPSLGTSPVLAGDSSVLAVDGIHGFDFDTNHLVHYSVSQQMVLWDISGHFVSNPVIASGPVYVVNSIGNQLEARDEATGNVLWTWQPPGNGETTPAGNLILTNNLVFLSTGVATYAIDLTTHQSVWSTPHVGRLALSANKVLYISSQSDYTVYAYTLN